MPKTARWPVACEVLDRYRIIAAWLATAPFIAAPSGIAYRPAGFEPHPVRFLACYGRNGTTSLFAALDVAAGFVIGKCSRRRRSREFLYFLKEIDRRVPERLDIQIFMDNYATHTTTAVKA